MLSVEDIDGLDESLFPGILKTTRMGYDGKGQAVVADKNEAREAFAAMGGLIAPGTDAGAWAVPHGSLSEYALLKQALGENAENVLSRGAAEIQRKF
mgnify:CR=1 FL=1